MSSINSKYPRGSEWRRWDLHVHTPESALCNNFPDWDTYISELERKQGIVSAIGVTDYTSIKGYKKLREIKNSGRLDRIDEIFPNIEFRIIPETKKGKGINIHIIVNPANDNHIEQIEDALNRLCFIYQGQKYSCNKKGLTDLGCSFMGSGSPEKQFKEGVNQFKPSFDTIKTWYDEEEWLKKNSIVVVSNGSGDGVSGLKEGGLKATREEIYRFADAIFSANPKDRNYFLGKGADDPETIIKKYGSLKPCLHGSDAHSLEQLFNPEQDRFCWIKADVNFNGLKQICYEPEARVKIQTNNPNNDFRKPYFSEINLSGHAFNDDTPAFKKNTIKLNQDMVTLVGGRGTGKSLLLDCIYLLFQKEKLTVDYDRFSRLSPDEFQVTYTKSNNELLNYKFGESANLDYLHVKQGDIKRIANTPKELSNEIKQLLNITGPSNEPDFEFELSSLVDEIRKIKSWIKEVDDLGKEVNSKTYNQTVIEKYKALVNTLTTDEFKELIDKYQENSYKLSNLTSLIQSVKNIRLRLFSFEEDVNREISELNSKESFNLSVELIDLKGNIENINIELTKLSNRVEEIKSQNSKIEAKFKEIGIDQDVGGLLDKLSIYQKEIANAEKKIEEYYSKHELLLKYVQRRKEIAGRIIEDLNENQNKINEQFGLLKKGKESWTEDQKDLVKELLKDIDIEGKVVFDEEKFYKGLSSLLNGNKFRASAGDDPFAKIKSKIKVSSLLTYLSLIKNEKIIEDSNGDLMNLDEFASQKEYFTKSSFDIYDYLFGIDYRKDYLYVSPVIKYQGKTPDKLSVGQRGTFYVCMKLATDPFGSPFIFDQPEDDLDNKFIMKELVPLFRRIKKYRQVIIATHNANLVVNADAEQVIIASNDGEILSYFSGALEHSSSSSSGGIRESVCEILEGGQAAFETREKKYGFSA